MSNVGNNMGAWGNPGDISDPADCSSEQMDDRERKLMEANRNLQNELLWRAEAERSIQANEARFRELFENMSSGVIIFEKFVISDEDIRLVVKEVNNAAERIDQTQRENVVGCFVYEAFPHLQNTELGLALERLLRGGEPERIAEAAYNLPGGERWRECYAYQLPSEEVVLVYDDITEKHEFETKMAAMNKQLQEASRQAGMAEIASGVLHNIGNALNSVNVALGASLKQSRRLPLDDLGKIVDLVKEKQSSLTDFVKDDPKGQLLIPFMEKMVNMLGTRRDEIVAELTRLRSGVEHIANIVSMQQDYAKGRAITEIISAKEVVEDALQLNRETLSSSNIAVDVSVGEGDLRINVTRHKVLEILVNLMRNAKQAMTEITEDNRNLRIRVSNCNDAVQIAIQDTGVGIPTENLTRIFGHGFSTRKEGHGFGLHSSSLAAKQMGGSLDVASDGTGTGATFTLTLPRPGK